MDNLGSFVRASCNTNNSALEGGIGGGSHKEETRNFHETNKRVGFDKLNTQIYSIRKKMTVVDQISHCTLVLSVAGM